ncbi:L,D-transpeptidase family protein [Jannaschia sp. S6380]|uniref:L,D-transpeptidase family protein n=1 Tax=Jannaschia sp. S6380 TaxID=2926408 RepID=UPI001FF52596|nr:L,D-transpeptidase family protein [Jannaschia sp. S6380]MCK0168167.1 L,D-transpeptidase family protein [Jannaschia sp. S6380]
MRLVLALCLALLPGPAPAGPPDLVPQDARADLIRVDKSGRRMDLLRKGMVIATYPIRLGEDGDDGHKMRQGDERTPEGRYTVDWRNPGSRFHLSLHISYPNAADRARAAAAGEDPGGDIMIHGFPNGWGLLAWPLHLMGDWTDGCIAVSDAQMREIWSLVPDGTPIEIRA